VVNESFFTPKANTQFSSLKRLCHNRYQTSLLVTLFLCITACGGGGGGSNASAAAPANSNGWVSGVFKAASEFINLCVAPRNGVDPATNAPYPDMGGTTLDENNWLRSWSNNTYLWYSEITDRDPGLYSNPLDYFDLLVTEQSTPSNKPKDQFHFSMPTDEWYAAVSSGTSMGYGVQFTIISQAPPREMLVAYTDPGSPATAPEVNLKRGAKILEIDGVDFVNDNTFSGVDTINAAVFPSSSGETHNFTIQDFGSDATRSITLTSQEVTSASVQNVHTIETASGNVGYMSFHSHTASAEQQLVAAVEQLQADGISDLVLDLRYNGGGFLAIASQLSYMVAGVNATAERVFELTQFNDKHQQIDPVIGEPIEPIPFLDTTQGLSLAPGQGLPTLDLPRLFVLTGNNTCSASEAIINGLRGIGFEVIQIGGTTCGKPYGSYAQDNCGTTYFTIQFKGVNDKGFGDYTDGFSPDNDANASGVKITGCSISDDFSRELGDIEEGRLAAALAYRDSGSCPATITSADASAKARKQKPMPVNDGVITRPPWLQNRIL